jgi:hypothetical protein
MTEKKAYPRMSEVALALATRQPRSPISHTTRIYDKGSTSTTPKETLVDVSSTSDDPNDDWAEVQYDRLHAKYGNGGAA